MAAGTVKNATNIGFGKRLAELTLSAEGLAVEVLPSSSACCPKPARLLSAGPGLPFIPRADYVGAQALADAFVVMSYQKRGKKASEDRPRRLVRDRFQTGSVEEATAWVDALTATLARPRKLMVIVNPFAGRKKGERLWRGVEPLFRAANITCDVKVTTHAGHAREIASGMNLDRGADGGVDGVVIVSGDGLVHEVLQGLLNRPDWNQARLMPIGVLPAGSGNGLSLSMHGWNMAEAACGIITGDVYPMDVISALPDGEGAQRMYSFLSFTWAFIADADLGTDSMRWMGPARFTLYGAYRSLVNVRRYPGTVRVHAQAVGSDSRCCEGCSVCAQAEQVEYEDAPAPPMPLTQEDKSGWEEMTDDFLFFCVSNVAWASKELKFSPTQHPCDGSMHLTTLGKKKGNAAVALAPVALTMETGDHIGRCKLKRTRAVRLEPASEHGYFSLDGEPIPITPITLETMPGLIRIMGRL